ncbi:MAG: precorrin-2 C(20)-methyltransferase [Hyphomicrobium sp.]|nr:precorrin-2 C(20)-methyltransferase [Hyphomicrobium sp.]
MGRVICCGLGPGDPELMSVRADRLIRVARHVAYFRKKGRPGQARKIVEGMLAPYAQEYAMEYPVTTELPFQSAEYNSQLAAFYDAWAGRIRDIAKNDDVVVLCEGDPFFYGSFMHLFERLREHVETIVVPGIPGMTGCWNAAGIPITWGDDVMTVLMGTLHEDDLARRMSNCDALVVMKTGRNLPKIRRALMTSGRLGDAWLVERGTMAGERIARLADIDDEVSPYFAIVLVHGKGRRPGAVE